MKFSLSILFAVICWESVAQPAPTASTEAIQLKKVILEKHLEPGLVDNGFSSDAFGLLLNDSDPEHLYFLQEEIDKLNSMHDKIDNDLNLNSWVFFPLFAAAYEKALQRAEKILIQESSKPFDLGKKDVRRADTTWCADESQLRARWSLVLKSETLQDMANVRKSKAAVAEKDFLAAQEPVSRKKAQTARIRSIRRIFDHPSGFQDFLLDKYYNALSNAFDPHTVYFSPTQMENFLSALSSEGFYFGFSIRESESGEIEIANLLPGGPAWKSGEFNSGDVIERLRWEGKEWMDLAGVTEEEVDAKLSESNQSAMEFVLRKSAGLSKTIRLKKEKLNTEESMVKGFVLAGKRRIGYISLPDFYSSWGDNEGAKCAGDVAAEIVKLRKQNIEGLILDVRYNGGGSLQEAMNMAGIFIDAGPVGVQRVKGQEPFTLKDTNRGTVYDGPLVIMVNGVSASASEFLSAALQDYHRAIIVGSNTYGKATAQEMFSLRPGKADVDFGNLSSTSWGYVKVTTGKTYRINGRSIQQKGVRPDIILPDLANAFEPRESNQPHALKSDSVNKKTYWTPLPELPIPWLKEQSQVRVDADPGFKAVSDYLDLLKRDELLQEVLTWENQKAEMELREKMATSLKNAFSNPRAAFEVHEHDFSRTRMDLDEYARNVSEAWKRNLSRDFSLAEAFHIICDYIDTVNNKN